MKRIDFIRNSAIFTLSALTLKANAFSQNSKTLKVGLIGVNGMGWSNLNAILKIDNIECVALCDVVNRQQKVDS